VHTNTGRFCCALLLSLTPGAAAAQLRELSTDRPDQTESPYSVEAGHVQVESEPFSYAITREAGATLREIHVMNMNVRIGLSQAVDAQVVLLPLTIVRTEVAGETSSHAGFGDTALRVKINLVGNDGGDFALGLLPFVVLPTASHETLGARKAELGFAVPIGIALPAEFALGLMTQVDAVAGETHSYAAELTQTATIGHALVGELGAFIEGASTVSFENETAASLELHGGLTYGIGADIQLDAGVFGTLVGEGEDLRVFAGFTFRY
jgi:hypothetical protein